MAPPEPPKKPKFAPKAPPRRAPKPEVKAEKTEMVDNAERATKLMQQFQERSLRGRNKIEKKPQVSQVAFGFGGSSTLNSYAMRRHRNMDNNGGNAVPAVAQKEYNEPWDYYSYYPVTLPMRRPYSGNPAILDEQEFGGAGEDISYDESVPTPAEDLDLLVSEENVEPTMMFIQLPTTMPVLKTSSTAVKGNTASRSKGGGCKLEELPGGYMGKMLVYRSGAVKLKLGDTLYNVSFLPTTIKWVFVCFIGIIIKRGWQVCAGMEGTFAQDVVAMNTAEKRCCAVAEVDKRVILIPDIEAITANMADL
ncbi:hypothetical protein LINPERPRIM_LOCUS11825 [Linum perenne]